MLFRGFDNKILSEAEILSDNGFKVETIGPDSASYRCARSAMASEVRTSTIRIGRGLPIVNLPLLLCQFLLAFRNNPDICHCYGMSEILCAWAFKILRRRVIYDVGDDIPSMLGAHVGRGLRSKEAGILCEAILRAFEGISCGRFDRVITLSNWLTHNRLPYNKNTSTLGYYPHPSFNPMNVDSSLIRRYGTFNMAIYDGNITEEKGLDTMLHVADMVRQEVTQFKLLLIGDFLTRDVRAKFGERLAELGVERAVEITGWIPHYDVPKYINLGKVGLSILEDWCLSYRISEPYKVFEMMACGKPVIASNTNLVGRMIVEESGGGVLVDQSDVRGIADSLIHLLRNDRERKLMGIRARKYIQKHRNWTEFQHEFLSMYEPFMRKDSKPVHSRNVKNATRGIPWNPFKRL